MEFTQASKSFRELNPQIFSAETPKGTFAEGTLGQVLLEPKPTKEEAKSEKQLQDQITAYLERHGTVVIRSRMDRKTSNNLGTPDLLFAIRMRAVAMEVKLPGKKLTEEQHNMMLRMTGNGWACFTVHSYDQAVEVIRGIKQ